MIGTVLAPGWRLCLSLLPSLWSALLYCRLPPPRPLLLLHGRYHYRCRHRHRCCCCCRHPLSPQRTADGTLVALPNKLVSDLIVYNRTRTLEAAPQPAAAVAAAPLRRVLCFTLQLDRSLEPQLDSIRDDVRALLNQITKDQLIQSGLTPEPTEEGEASASVTSSRSHDDDGDDTKTGSNAAVSNAAVSDAAGSDAAGSDAGKADVVRGPAAAAAAVATAAAELAAAAAAGAGKQKGSQAGASGDQQGASPATAAAAAAATVSRDEGSGSPEPEPLLVSITLKQLTESKISLFVR
jgi:hypothetical protein